MFLGKTIVNNVDMGKICRQHKCILLVFLFPHTTPHCILLFKREPRKAPCVGAFKAACFNHDMLLFS